MAESKMITVERALELVVADLPPRRSERVELRSALGRVLAEDLAANSDVPPFRRSAMDGYAVRASDTLYAPIELEIAGEIRAGGSHPRALGSKQAVAIMTGAPVPDLADAVQIVELTKRSGDGRRVTILKTVQKGDHITPAGSEASLGQTVLESGRSIGPAELAVLANFGYCSTMVWKPPGVAIVTTGDELVEATEIPVDGKIRNTNAYSLDGQLRLLGIEGVYQGIAHDDRQVLRNRMESGLEMDVLILTGGVSMGEYDLVREVMLELGFELIFTQVAMKPGKPTVFARRGDKMAFGLPGNPVSAFIAFENLVRPALGRLCGFSRPDLPKIKGALLRDMRQSPGRTAFLPARAWWELGGWKIEPLRWKGSADIIGFSRANAALIFPRESEFMAAGDTAEAMLLPDFFLRNQIG
jgi:molybdopterin molybdotransferase